MKLVNKQINKKKFFHVKKKFCFLLSQIINSVFNLFAVVVVVVVKLLKTKNSVHQKKTKTKNQKQEFRHSNERGKSGKKRVKKKC